MTSISASGRRAVLLFGRLVGLLAGESVSQSVARGEVGECQLLDRAGLVWRGIFSSDAVTEPPSDQASKQASSEKTNEGTSERIDEREGRTNELNGRMNRRTNRRRATDDSRRPQQMHTKDNSQPLDNILAHSPPTAGRSCEWQLPEEEEAASSQFRAFVLNLKKGPASSRRRNLPSASMNLTAKADNTLAH